MGYKIGGKLFSTELDTTSQLGGLGYTSFMALIINVIFALSIQTFCTVIYHIITAQ